MLNHIVVMGRLTSDPELRVTKNDRHMCNFKLAIDRDMKDQPTDFIGCSAWGNTADFICRNYKKGKLVAVSGRLMINDWLKDDGTHMHTPEISVEHTYFGGEKRDDRGFAEPENKFEEMDIEDGDIPF